MLCIAGSVSVKDHYWQVVARYQWRYGTARVIRSKALIIVIIIIILHLFTQPHLTRIATGLCHPPFTTSYESCWPAILADAHGVVLVYNPDKPAHEQEVALW